MQINTPADYRAAMVARLTADLEANKNYLKVCRQQVNESEDPETLGFWARQQDRALMSIRAINANLQAFSGR